MPTHNSNTAAVRHQVSIKKERHQGRGVGVPSESRFWSGVMVSLLRLIPTLGTYYSLIIHWAKIESSWLLCNFACTLLCTFY